MSKRRKPRRGPLPGTTGAGRTAVLRVRVSPEEHAAYVAAAERAGVPLSEWVRGRMFGDGWEPARAPRAETTPAKAEKGKA